MRNVDLIIIGGGSAGLAAAKAAYDAGIRSLMILEKEHYLGGILLQCIHNGFGLTTFQEELTGPEYASRYVREIIERGIEVHLEAMVVEITPDKQVHYSNLDEGYVMVQAKAIICATGCSERTRGAINIPGSRPAGIITAGLAQKYINIDGYHVGKRVFILGSGDIGLIMARRLRFEGVEVLGVAEIMPYSNGLNRNLVQCLYDFSIPLYLHHTVKEIVGKTRLERIVITEVDDTLNPIPGTEKSFEVDTLLLSVGLIPSNPVLEKTGINLHPRTKGPWVDEALQTTIPGIFACGNSLHVHDLVDFVSIEGAKAGLNAALYIKGLVSVGPTMDVTSGCGVGYVLPQRIHADKKDPIQISYRVTKPYKNVFVLLRQGDKILKKVRKPFLFPAEMEQITLDMTQVEGMTPLTLEVLDA